MSTCVLGYYLRAGRNEAALLLLRPCMRRVVVVVGKKEQYVSIWRAVID